MNKHLLALAACTLFVAPAAGADLSKPMYKAPLLASPAINWSGWYAGLHAGYVTSDATVRDTNGGVTTPGPFGYSPDGGFGGGQIGYNWQVSPNWVFGIEGDVGYMGLEGGRIIGSDGAASHQNLTLSSGFYGDITARLGFVLTPSTLIYAKGGYAYFDGKSAQTTTNPGYVTNPAHGFDGWTVGAGVEWMIAQNVSIKAEYQHFDFGSQGGNQTSVGDPPIGFVYTNTTKLTMDTVKAGMNYHFNAW